MFSGAGAGVLLQQTRQPGRRAPRRIIIILPCMLHGVSSTSVCWMRDGPECFYAVKEAVTGQLTKAALDICRDAELCEKVAASAVKGAFLVPEMATVHLF